MGSYQPFILELTATLNLSNELLSKNSLSKKALSTWVLAPKRTNLKSLYKRASPPFKKSSRTALG
ncbi:MAG: hypothetical protein A2W46_02540 [Alphaproteobacteria bacterium RIFCSPHIGHO2_12_42_13]|nr:MAG: hypothetical protein A2W46_02540 [Alphaproteobacteria bacterium RIFCSPHIGHO2_12_42_13]HBG34389.1 hypothetical protein [Holosporales bacterium]HBW24151.1 hypothetical protein [Holosporales bacterium]